MHYIRRNSWGLTFIEIVLVTAIMSIVSLAIYSTLNNGLKIWQRINQTLFQEDLNILLDKFSFDLKNSFRFADLSLSGTADRLELVTLVNSERLKNRTVGKVIYYWDPNSEVINREQKDFSHVFANEDGEVRKLMKSVKSLKFQYYFYDKEKKEFLWKDEWQKTELPLAVRVELYLEDDAGAYRFTRTAEIPFGG